MKKKARLLMVLLLLVVLAAALLLISKFGKDSETEDETLVLKHMDADAITSFSYQHRASEEYDDKLYRFEKEGGVWYYAEDRNFPVNQSFAAAKAKIIETVEAERVVEENPKDLAPYGLKDPYLTVSISDGKETGTYYVGDYNASTTTYYLRMEGDNTVYLADANLFLAFDMQVWDMIDKESDPVLDAASFEKITFAFPDRTIVLEREERQNDTVQPNWYLLDENGNRMENTDFAAAGQYAKKIAGLSYAREVDYQCTEAEEGRYGFTEPALVITAAYRENDTPQTFVLTIGGQSEESNIYEDLYVRSSTSAAVFTITYEDLEPFFEVSIEDLLH